MSETQVLVRSDQSGLCFLQNHPKLAQKHISLMANGVMDIVPGRPFRVLISNFSDKPLRFHKNTVVELALASPGGIFSVEDAISGHGDVPLSTEGGGKQSGSQTDDGQSTQDTWRESVHIGSEDSVPREKVMELLSDFEDMWSSRLGNISPAKHRIDLIPDAKSVYQVPYRAGH